MSVSTRGSVREINVKKGALIGPKHGKIVSEITLVNSSNKDRDPGLSAI